MQRETGPHRARRLRHGARTRFVFRGAGNIDPLRTGTRAPEEDAPLRHSEGLTMLPTSARI